MVKTQISYKALTMPFKHIQSLDDNKMLWFYDATKHMAKVT